MISLLYGGSGTSESYKRYIICKEFGWDYHTYMNQPVKFIEEILIIMNQEAQKTQSDRAQK